MYHIDMPRSARVNIDGVAYHVLNRSNGRLPLFECHADYCAFQSVVAAAHERVAMRTIGYCIMPNHWHMLLWPRKDGDLSEFLRSNQRKTKKCRKRFLIRMALP